MKYYLVAGEASGDLHGAMLIKELLLIDSTARFRCWGGNSMMNAGAELVKDYKNFSIMGFWEVLKNIFTITRLLKKCKKDIRAWSPDALILIDFPGFNLRLARFASECKIPVFYYISPKIWAWKESRINSIKKYVGHMFSILPFEPAFYLKHNYAVEYIGNPLVDSVDVYLKKSVSHFTLLDELQLNDKKIIALLPGSRKQEIEKILPVMATMAKYFTGYHFIIAGISSLPVSLYRKHSCGLHLPLLFDRTYELLSCSHAAIVTSGTAVLETALLNVPQVALYKTSRLSYLIARALIKTKYITLVNLILNKPAINEIIQNKMSETLRRELEKLLQNDNYRHQIINDYQRLRQLLGPAGAVRRAAQSIHAKMND